MELENLEQHLSILSQKDWNKLFTLIPEIEKKKIFGTSEGGEYESGVYIMPYDEQDEIVDNFVHIVVDILEIAPTYNWLRWEEGKEILNDEDTDYNSLDIVKLCKLLTMMIRSDRFNEGALVSYFEEGIILKLLKALEQKVKSL